MITIYIDEKDASLLAVHFPADTLSTMRCTHVIADKISILKSPLAYL